jgi:hypothetical protein
MVRAGDGLAAELLVGLGATVESLREGILKELNPNFEGDSHVPTGDR